MWALSQTNYETNHYQSNQIDNELIKKFRTNKERAFNTPMSPTYLDTDAPGKDVDEKCIEV